jgi:hypothetical protein
MTKGFQGAHVAQMVERVLGKDEVISSILIVGSMFDGTTDTVATNNNTTRKQPWLKSNFRERNHT